MDSETQTVIFYFGYSKFGTVYLSAQPYRYLKTDILCDRSDILLNTALGELSVKESEENAPVSKKLQTVPMIAANIDLY